MSEWTEAKREAERLHAAAREASDRVNQIATEWAGSLCCTIESQSTISIRDTKSGNVIYVGIEIALGLARALTALDSRVERAAP